MSPHHHFPGCGHNTPPCPPNNPHCNGTEPPNPGNNNPKPSVSIDMYVPTMLIVTIILITFFKTFYLYGNQKNN